MLKSNQSSNQGNQPLNLNQSLEYNMRNILLHKIMRKMRQGD